ncbi:hypothetical protein F5888DRAFT_1800270 [Russula emetica]|nr:hypothetical protein F5888DRAFT_1800270 [Russula emetica]
MPTHLLHLPKELLENILVLICRDNAQTIQTCRQTCRTLKTIITQSILVQYLERLTLLGMHDPQLLIGDGGSVTLSPSAALALPDRMMTLQAWEEAWNPLGASGRGVFWRKRSPDLRITLPPWQPMSSSPKVTHMFAMILDPDPIPEDPFPEGLQELAELIAIFARDDTDRFSFGPCFITSTHTGPSIQAIRPAYSYLDLHGRMGGSGTGTGALDGIQGGEEEDVDVDTNYDRLDWTVINIPVWNVVEIALSTELDLAVVISVLVEFEGQEEETCHLTVRPLRFRDGTPHPCAIVPTMRFSVTRTSAFQMTRAQVLGDYLLLWIAGASERRHSVAKLYVIAWKQGSITLLRENSTGKYGAVHMISTDILALIQLDPPGIELCRVSNMRNEGEEGATNSSHHSSQNDGPRMDRLCTLLFSPLRQRDGTGAGATASTAFCVGEHSGHQTFSCEPWPEYHHAPLGRGQIFRQSTRDSVVSVTMGIVGCDGRLCNFEVVVRCETLLSYADGVHVVPTAAVVGDVNAKEGNGNDVVLWDVWGPQATSVTALDSTPVGWRNLFGERRATIEKGGQIRIRDYNSYRIRRARDSNVGLDQNGTCRIVKSSTIRGGEWFEEDVTTMLPYLDIVADVRGCKEIYLEQDEVLLRVDNLPFDEVAFG